MWTICFLIVLQGFFSVYALSPDENLRSQLNHFNTTRHSYVNPQDKAKARDHIVKTFKDFGLDTWTEEFPSNQASYPGINVVGRVNGRYTGTNKDKIVVIGSHYDTVTMTHGVDDNGSGMTAMLQIIAKYKDPGNVRCNQNHTLLFVAFDLEEFQGCGVNQSNCSCAAGLCGSGFFVHNLTSHLNNTGVTLQGAFILETILNYNTSENSQTLPAGFDLVFPGVYNVVKNNQFKGDFLAVIGRKTDDAELMHQLVSNFDQGRFKAKQIPLPFNGRPSALPVDLRNRLRDFFRSDHAQFWDSANSWPALFITDTANFRGFMAKCYHEFCDNMDHVTPDMITFLGKTADALVKAAHTMTERVCPEQQYCASAMTSDKVNISSPHYPAKYPSSLNCSWSRKSEYPQTLVFADFDLENSENCVNDYVEVLDGGKSKGRFCGSTKPPAITTAGKSVQLGFVSDAFVSKKGFKVTWTTKSQPTATATRFHGSNYVMGFLLIAMFSLL